MKKHFTEVKEEPTTTAGAKGCTVRWLISKDHGALHYAMRLFTLQPGGIIPVHKHEDNEHEIFILEGEATLDDGREKRPVREGDVIFVEAGEEHSFVNHARRPMRFICVIPL